MCTQEYAEYKRICVAARAEYDATVAPIKRKRDAICDYAEIIAAILESPEDKPEC